MFILFILVYSPVYKSSRLANEHVPFKAAVLKVVDIDPQGSTGPSKGSINRKGIEWGSLNGQGVNE